MLRRKHYRDAITAQGACNLTGVLKTYNEVMGEVRKDFEGRGEPFSTDDVNQHPISVLYAVKIQQLSTGLGFTDGTAEAKFVEAYLFAKVMAEKPLEPPKAEDLMFPTDKWRKELDAACADCDEGIEDVDQEIQSLRDDYWHVTEEFKKRLRALAKAIRAKVKGLANQVDELEEEEHDWATDENVDAVSSWIGEWNYCANFLEEFEPKMVEERDNMSPDLIANSDALNRFVFPSFLEKFTESVKS